MSNLTDQAEWGPIYQRKPTDPLDAGPNGLDNLPNQQLANRTAYLRLQGVAPWQSTFTYPAQAMTKVGNALYVALRANLNKNPTALGADWVKFKPDMADLSAATTAARGIIQLATAAEVAAGTVNNKAVAPNTLKIELDKKLNSTGLVNATATVRGIIQLATAAEVTAGTVNNKAVAPDTLKVELDKKLNSTGLVNATTTANGIIQLATTAEVTAGTVNNKAVAPNTLKAELDKKLNATALVNATTAARGIIQLATAAEVTAGTVNNKAVAPNTLRAELAKRSPREPIILAKENLNDVLVSDTYIQLANANTSSALNYPSNQAGTLTVINTAGITTQLYHLYNSGQIYTRARYNGSWYAWDEQISHRTLAAAMPKGRLLWSGNAANFSVNVGTAQVIACRINTRGGFWVTAVVEAFTTTGGLFGLSAYGGENADRDYSAKYNVTKSGTTLTFQGVNTRITAPAILTIYGV